MRANQRDERTGRRGRHFANSVQGESHGALALRQAYSECGFLTVAVTTVAYLTVPAICSVLAMIALSPAYMGVRAKALLEASSRLVPIAMLLFLASRDDALASEMRIRAPKGEPMGFVAVALLSLFPVARLMSVMGDVGDGIGTGATGVAYYLARTCYVGVMEELIFRGMFVPVLRRRMGDGMACFVSSLAFALMHVPVSLMAGWGAVLVTVPFAFLFGVAACEVADCCGSIIPGMVVHFVYDALGVLSVF